MWKFWAILTGALIAGGIYVVAQVRPTPPAAKVDPAERVEAAPVQASPEPPPAPSVTAVEPVRAETPELKPAAPVAVEAPTQKEETPAPAPSEPSAPPKPSPEEVEGFDDLVPKEPVSEVAPAAPAPVVEHKAEPAPENLKKFGDFFVTPARIEKKEDGSLLLDGKYVLKGDGTPEKPYLVSWDLLVSAEEGFDPQNGKRRIPERIAMLDGKAVRLNGYIAFPMTSTEPRELLSMLNQWDGCCIGTPPTPYDAVEVALTRAVDGDDRFASTGKVVGTFHVKPYLEGDWLIGLYVMEDAKLTPRDFGPGGN